MKHFSQKELIQFVKKMFIINIPWLILLFINELFSLYTHFLETSTLRQNLDMGPSNLSIFPKIAVFVIAYFMLISFILTQKKNFRDSVKLGIKHFYPLFIFYLLSIVVLFFLSIFSVVLVRLGSVPLLLVYEIFIVLGFIVFSRIVFYAYFNKTATAK